MRIVFRIIGSNEVGMGHIYRTLTLAREFTTHEVLFVTDTENVIASATLAKYDYWLSVCAPDEVINQICVLRPDLVIYDALDTTMADICRLRDHGSVVVSFEDLGSGAQFTHLTINELYDAPQFKGKHILWGRKYFVLRDEFYSVEPHKFHNRVDCIMLAFGGTDQHNLSSTIFHAVKVFCKKNNIFIHIVTGPGYGNYESLSAEIEKEEGVELTHASGVISGIMEKAQLSITSNGRTVYEFAHMNVPSIVIAQHDRELTHKFANENNGFHFLGRYQSGETEKQALAALMLLVNDNKYRLQLFRSVMPHSFSRNKHEVVKNILQLLDTVDG